MRKLLTALGAGIAVALLFVAPASAASKVASTPSLSPQYAAKKAAGAPAPSPWGSWFGTRCTAGPGHDVPFVGNGWRLPLPLLKGTPCISNQFGVTGRVI